MKLPIVALVLASTTLGAGVAPVAAAAVCQPDKPAVLPPQSRPLGLSYAQWSAKWWQWLLAQPLAGHPSVVSPEFNIAAGQSGPVWYLASPVDEVVVRNCTIPWGKALFITLIGSEWSDLEGYLTEQEQRELAVWYADHMSDVFCTVDGVPVANIDSYRFESEQFEFTAPSPWIFAATGGQGNAVADGFYIFLQPLSVGTHVIHYGGQVHFSVAAGDPFDYDGFVDITYNLTVTP